MGLLYTLVASEFATILNLPRLIMKATKLAGN